MATIIINGIDFGGHVIAGTYAVQNNNIYAAWTDGNGSNHRQLKREKMQGSFDMFLELWKSMKHSWQPLKHRRKPILILMYRLH